MEGQNQKMKGLRQRGKDGRTGGQRDDGHTDREDDNGEDSADKQFKRFMACKVASRDGCKEGFKEMGTNSPPCEKKSRRK